MDSATPMIEIRDLDFGYSGYRSLFSGLNLSIRHNERVLLLGPVGSGKSTLTKLIIGAERPTRGVIALEGIENPHLQPHEVYRCLGVTFHHPDYQIFHTSVESEIAFCLRLVDEHRRAFLLNSILEKFELSNYRHEHPYDLHPSLRKMVVLASVVALNPPFFIFDEPTALLGRKERNIFSKILKELQSEHKGFVLITHDTEFGLPHCDRIIILKQGRIELDENLDSFLGHSNSVGILKRSGIEIPFPMRIASLMNSPLALHSVDELVNRLMK